MTANARAASAALLGALVVGLSGAGCGKPVLRIADASLGDYYTDEEFKKLSRGQRDEYCAELARQDSAFKAELGETREALDALRSRSQSLRAEGDSLARIASALEAEARGASSRGRRIDGGGGAQAVEPRAEGGGARTFHVRPGDSLWRISGLKTTLGGGARWPRIYEANKDRIRDPNLIHPGQELTIPR